MNEEEQMDALRGGSGDSGNTDWQAKYAELEKKFNSVRVEEGRVKKLNEEKAAMEKELAELRAAKVNDDLMSSLTEEERAGVPDEVLNAAVKIVGKAQADNERRWKEQEASRMEQEAAVKKDRVSSFLRSIDERFPGFRNSITVGGDKVDAWESYKRYNRATIEAALASCDFDVFAHHIEKFYTDHLGSSVPTGRGGYAAPDPVNSGSGAGGIGYHGGKVYTVDEYNSLFDLKEAARDRGDFAEVARITNEINRARAEDRVKA